MRQTAEIRAVASSAKSRSRSARRPAGSPLHVPRDERTRRAGAAVAQPSRGPQYRYDPTWPKQPLPNAWTFEGITGLFVDRDDQLSVVDRNWRSAFRSLFPCDVSPSGKYECIPDLI